MQTMFWIWMAAAVIFLIIEQFMPTMIFLSFGVAAAISAVYAQFKPDSYYWQIGIFVIVTVLVFPLSRHFAKRITKAAPNSNVDAMIGSTALVVAAIQPDHPGKVRFEGEVWQALSDEAINENEKVRILAVSGTRVRVQKA